MKLGGKMEDISRTKKRDTNKKLQKITIIKYLLDLAVVAVICFLLYRLAWDFYNHTDLEFLDERVMLSGKQLLATVISWIVLQIIYGLIKRKMK